MIKKYSKEQLSEFLGIVYSSAKKSYTEEMAEKIIFVSKFINEKYPDMDVETKLINNLLKYKFSLSNGRNYIVCLERFIKKSKSLSNIETNIDRYDLLLDLITNNKKVSIMLLMLLCAVRYFSDKDENETVMDKFPYLSAELINNIDMSLYNNESDRIIIDCSSSLSDMNKNNSTGLSIDEILFLLELVEDKDVNIKVSEKINKQNYTTIIENIIGDFQNRIKFFRIIYPYFNKFSTFEWYDLYKFMNRYEDNKNAVEYFSKNIKELVDFYMKSVVYDAKVHGIRSYFDLMVDLAEDSKEDLFLKLLNDNIPLLLLLNINISCNIDLFKIIKKKISSIILKKSDVTLNRDMVLHYSKDISYSLRELIDKNKLLVQKILDNIFDFPNERFYFLSELIDHYGKLYRDILNKNFYLNSDLNNFLISLLDRDEWEIVLYINLFERLFSFKDDDMVYSFNSEHFISFELEGNIVKINDDDGYMKVSKYLNKFLTGLLIFMIHKNDVKKSLIFLKNLKRLIPKINDKNIIINSELLELIYEKIDEAEIFIKSM